MDPRWCQDGPKIGQGSAKTAQDAPKMAQDGPKMGADRGPRSTPDRSFASDLLADSWRPVLGSILDGFGDHFGAILGAFWDNLGTILAHFGSILGSWAAPGGPGGLQEGPKSAQERQNVDFEVI